METKTITTKRFMNIHELSEFLGVCVNTIYSWGSQRKIPFVKVGRLLRFDRQKIEAWLSEREHSAGKIKPLEF